MRAPLVLVAATALLGTATAQFTSQPTGGGFIVGGQTGSSTGKGSSFSRDAASAAAGVGDPILTGFDGRTFEFVGEVGRTYNLLSEQNHQLSTRLKAAHMWDHNGTYMEAFSLRYREHGVEVALGQKDDLVVSVDGQPVSMLPGEVEVEHIFGLAAGELQLQWQLHKAGYGNAVDISSELLQLLVWVTPAGTFDEGGKEQPAYLNFNLQLLAAPTGEQMQGVIGHTYADLGSPAEANDFEFHHTAAEYEMTGFSDASHTHNLFAHAGATVPRRLLGVTLPLKASVTGQRAAASKASFPLKATGRGASRQQQGTPQGPTISSAVKRAGSQGASHGVLSQPTMAQA